MRWDDLGGFTRLIVMRDAGIPLNARMTNREVATRIRDWVYRGFKPGKQPVGLERSEFFALLGSSSNEMLCDGAAGAYQWALEILGIPARVVDLAGDDFLSGKDKYQTHTTVEVYLDAGWEISDPTFNITLDCSDGEANLSTPQAAACLARGAQLIDRAGPAQLPGRTLREYYVPLASLFSAWRRDKVVYSSTREGMDEHPQSGWLKEKMANYSSEKIEKTLKQQMTDAQE